RWAGGYRVRRGRPGRRKALREPRPPYRGSTAPDRRGGLGPGHARDRGGQPHVRARDPCRCAGAAAGPGRRRAPHVGARAAGDAVPARVAARGGAAVEDPPPGAGVSALALDDVPGEPPRVIYVATEEPMNRPRALIGIVVATLVLIAAVGLIPVARAADPIRIGLGMALTGGLSANGKPALLAMQIWKDEINKKGGLLGRPVEL